MGNIGLAIAKRAHFGFGCNILYHNRRRKPEKEKIVKAKFFPVLNEMIPACDFLCVACPLTKSTKNIVDEAQFHLMKPSAILCNISRGGTVNQKALYRALSQDKIFGAALDVTGLNDESTLNMLCIIIFRSGTSSKRS